MRTLIKITRLAFGTLYLVIIGPNSRATFKLHVYELRVGSNIAQTHSTNLSGVILGFNSNVKCTKSVIMSSWNFPSKLGQGPID